MVREATIRQDDVFAVADRLKAAGQKATARAVRDELGRGSMATVLRHLQQWQALQGSAPMAVPSLPAGLQRALTEFIAAEVTEARRSLEQDLASAHQAQKDLIAENEGLLADLDGLQQTLEDMQAQHSQLEGRHAQLQLEATELKRQADAQRAGAEAARTEIATLKLKLEWAAKQEEETTRLREALERERTARIAAEQAAAVANARLEHFPRKGGAEGA